MITTVSDALKKANYYIEYNYSDELHKGEIFISWLDKRMDLDLSNVNLIPYTQPTFAKLLLEDVCQTYKYPYHRVFLHYNQARVQDFIYNCPLTEDEQEKAQNFENLISQVRINGLYPHDIDVAKRLNITDGVEYFLDYYYGLDSQIIAE